MQIYLNGKEHKTKENSNLEGLLSELSINSETVVVEHNKVVVARDSLGKVVLKPGDIVEIVRFVGGG